MVIDYVIEQFVNTYGEELSILLLKTIARALRSKVDARHAN